jgi:hypothetical protein
MMNQKFKITIPKPCHKNWNTMAQEEKGRFCDSCSKTVVDFTKKSTTAIQEYLAKNKNQAICGHFYKQQLHSITIEIPQITFHQQLSFQKLFILALFFVMGASLFSCQYSDGKKQKIENVIIVDTVKHIEKEIDTLKHFLKKETVMISKKRTVTPPPATTGIIICETKTEKNTVLDIMVAGELTEIREEISTEGAIEIVDGMLELEHEPDEEIVMGFIIEESPRFKEAKNLSNKKSKEDFDKKMKKFVGENFDEKFTQNLGLTERKYKIIAQFIIDKTGSITDIRIRAPHPKLKIEFIKILKKLPQFIPGKQGGKVVKTKYTLPITFIVE